LLLKENVVQIEIWSDVACPWCAVGKRRLETALGRFRRGDEVTVRWRSFELNPAAPRVRDGDYVRLLAEKYRTGVDEARGMIDRMTQTAAGEDLAFRFDIMRPGNTFDAHRLLHLAADRGVQDAVKERFLVGYLCEGEAIGHPDVLRRLATQAGLDDGEVEAVLTGDRYAADVRADEAEAREIGITGVPFFVLDRRYGVSGAQPPDVLLRALEEAAPDRHRVAMVASGDGGGGGCTDDSCAL
jgi:predicted DsbA family dithiol-disulfide isomerase